MFRNKSELEHYYRLKRALNDLEIYKNKEPHAFDLDQALLGNEPQNMLYTGVTVKVINEHTTLHKEKELDFIL